MTTYLLNMTLIWLVCLGAFETLLKGETYHQWNRLFLLLSVAAGLVLPLLSFDTPIAVAPYNRSIMVPVRQLTQLKQNIVPSGTEGAPRTITINWLWLCYIAGMLSSLILLLRESRALIKRYRNSNRIVYENYTLVETGIQEAPFSFFRFMFISSRSDYEPAELNMILKHEAQHVLLRHSADLALLRVLQLLLWFHPLVYLFKRRIRLIHEYQADAIARDNSRQYGTFLLEQNLFHNSPSFTNAFFHSPIKNRIIMLTKNSSSGWHLLKYAIVVPMAAFFIVACTHPKKSAPVGTIENKPVGNGKVMFKGNQFEMSKETVRPMEVKDEVTGEKHYISFSTSPRPIAMNGQPIYTTENITKASLPGTDPATFLFNQTKSRFETVPDGDYVLNVNNVVVDEHGKIVFYEAPTVIAALNAQGDNITNDTEGVTAATPVTDNAEKSVWDGIIAKVTDLMDNDMQFTPAIKDNAPVRSLVGNLSAHIIVTRHQAVLNDAAIY